MDAVVNFLKKCNWVQDGVLESKDAPDRPVFRRTGSKSGRAYAVLVGPVWVTYYWMDEKVIMDLDSVRTGDMDALSELMVKLR